MVEAEIDLLSDPCNDRVVVSVEPVPHRPLSLDRVFDANGINAELLMTWLRKGGSLAKDCMIELLTRTRELLAREPNIVRISGE